MQYVDAVRIVEERKNLERAIKVAELKLIERKDNKNFYKAEDSYIVTLYRAKSGYSQREEVNIIDSIREFIDKDIARLEQELALLESRLYNHKLLHGK